MCGTADPRRPGGAADRPGADLFARFFDTVGKGGKGHAGWKTAAFLELEQSCDCGVGHRGHGRSCGERVKGAGGRDVGLQNERTALAWQRTALSLIVGSAIVSKVTFERLGHFSTISMAVAVPAAVWIFLDSRGRYRQRRSGSITTSPRNGAARAAALSIAISTAAVSELAALVSDFSA